MEGKRFVGGAGTGDRLCYLVNTSSMRNPTYIPWLTAYRWAGSGKGSPNEDQ
ncbi:MAG: hypothetical protein QG599_885 [Pseudomonadota bacterium]|nr:hypothetical protein [Pseudomonadota bacterium]